MQRYREDGDDDHRQMERRRDVETVDLSTEEMMDNATWIKKSISHTD